MAKIVITSALPATLAKYKKAFGERVMDSSDKMILVKKVTTKEKAELSADSDIQIFSKRGVELSNQSGTKEKEKEANRPEILGPGSEILRMCREREANRQEIQRICRERLVELSRTSAAPKGKEMSVIERDMLAREKEEEEALWSKVNSRDAYGYFLPSDFK
ncbi:MAG: hypothetical protein HY094_02160 [Candidatus Melainabacteria bacterium]|nr:hypothetical protein [Candidatus Melainabacteria bacterium]